MTLSGEEILKKLLGIDHAEFGNTHDLLQQKKGKRVQSTSNWKKKNIYFELPYIGVPTK